MCGKILENCNANLENAAVYYYYERVSETGVFPSLDRVSGTLCLMHYVTEASHLHSLKRLLKTLWFV